MKFTQKDFKTFKKHCKKWIGRLAPEFNVNFVFKGLKGYESKTALCTPQKTSGLATIYLNPNLELDYKSSLDELAFHEVCHLLLAKLTMEAGMFLSENFIVEMEHEIISKLENALFKQP